MEDCHQTEVVAVDIGGTKILVASVSISNQPVVRSRVQIPTPFSSQPDSIVQIVTELVRETIQSTPGKKVDCVGICSTGVVDHRTGRILESVNLPFRDFPLRDRLVRELHLPIIVENDAKAAALGEFLFGAGAQKKWDTMIHVVVGTGIGGAIVQYGKLMRGASNLAGEFGHMSIDPDGPLCRCGRTGCVDAYSSGYGIVDFVRKEIGSGVDSILAKEHSIGLPQIVSVAERGDGLAVKALARAGEALGVMIVNLIHAFNPNAFVLSGGVLNARNLIWQYILTIAQDRTFPEAWAATEIHSATLGEESGLFGIAKLASDWTLANFQVCSR